MRVIIAKDYEELSKKAADIMEEIVRSKPTCTIGLATGSSPIGMYKELIRRCNDEGLDFSEIHSVNLDEYVGLEGTHEQSYRYFMDTNLFNHINIKKENTRVPCGTGDPEQSLKEYNKILDATEIEVQVLGIGPDGHLGFNEPGDMLYDKAHMETLDATTIDANKRFFASREEVPTRALTMGMGNIMRANQLLMVISGDKAEAATKLLINDRIDPHCPATFMRMHKNATVILMKELADKIGYKG